MEFTYNVASNEETNCSNVLAEELLSSNVEDSEESCKISIRSDLFSSENSNDLQCGKSPTNTLDEVGTPVVEDINMELTLNPVPNEEFNCSDLLAEKPPSPNVESFETKYIVTTDINNVQSDETIVKYEVEISGSCQQWKEEVNSGDEWNSEETTRLEADSLINSESTANDLVWADEDACLRKRKRTRHNSKDNVYIKIYNQEENTTCNMRKRSRAEYQKEYRKRVKEKSGPIQKQTTEEQRLRKAANSKAYRERKKQLMEEGRLSQIEQSEEQRLRKAANSKAYRERKKQLREQGLLTQTQRSEEQKRRSAAHSKACRDRLKLKKYITQELSVLQSQRENPFENVALIHETVTQDSNENKQIELHTEINKLVGNIKHQRERLQNNDNEIEQPMQHDNQVESIGVDRHVVYIKDEIDEDQFEDEGDEDIDDDDEEESNAFDHPDHSEVHETGASAGFGQILNRINASMNKYTDFKKHVVARVIFNKQFIRNPFGHPCGVCDRLWFKNDLKLVRGEHKDILRQIIQNYQDGSTTAICSTCYVAIRKNNIPSLSTYNGFKYHDLPTHLPKLDVISERLISPRIPFMQIIRLRHYGQPEQYNIYGQVINVPVETDTMVRNLPRDLDDERSVYVHVRRKLIFNSSHLLGLINKIDIEVWLRYLVDTPLFVQYGISINESFFNSNPKSVHIDEVSENIPNEETLVAQQQTILWDENKSPAGLLFDEHAEELSFPSIYLGQVRRYKITVTPYMQANSELRRTDRRGAKPNHILYLAMKIMRLRVKDCLSVAYKHIGASTIITKEQIMQKEYINSCIDSNLAFLKSIPNSTWYWTGQKRELFAMIRQLGRPTAFMTLSANESKWIYLLMVLYKLQKRCVEVSMEDIENLNPMERSNLVNEDPVTCTIYFSKLVNVLLTILMAKKNSPFGKYAVVHYYKRIEFQHGGSPHAHILLWLDNAPEDIFGQNYKEAIDMINSLIAVSASEASGYIKLNTHKHDDACYKKCRFGAPFMPSRETVILTPMKEDEENYKAYRKQYAEIQCSLESCNHTGFDDFYTDNNIISDQHYYDILRAGIDRPKLFVRRLPSEKWHVCFNPFIFNLLQSNMDFQIILDEYSCAQYIVEYVNKSNKGISDLQRQIVQIMDEHPEFDITEITRKMGVDMLNTVEMSSQEAAWYLLREPMSKSSELVVYIPTEPPEERQRVKKNMVKFNNESTDIWKENLIDKYEKRPEKLNSISLAQFVAKFYKNNKGEIVERKEPRIIRYRNYDMAYCFNDYRREMVTLHIPFRNEQKDILLKNKYVIIYEDKKDLIMLRKKEFESNLDIEKTMQICEELCRENNEHGDDQEVTGIVHEQNQYMRLLADP